MARTALGVLLAAGALAMSGCGAAKVEEGTIEGAHLGGASPGSLISAETLPGLDHVIRDAGVLAARVTYRSTNSTTGEGTVVSGTVFVPGRPAPRGGWPVVALGHGSTGILPNCAPSDSPTLWDQAELVARLAGLGVAVTMTDYEGLGEPGVHPYTDSETAGLNVIDSVRAVRATFPDVSTQWAAFGGSQGGGAVWAADERARTYAPELDLVGVVALAPASDLTGLVDKAVAGTLTTDQRAVYQWVLASQKRLHPDLDLAPLRHGAARENWTELSSCDLDADERAQLPIGPDDLTPTTAAAAAPIKAALTAYALPRGPLSAPMLVGYGAKDTFIDPAWTTTALAKACQLGGEIQARLDPEGDHESTDIGDPLTWIAERFAGKPAQNDCPGS